MEQETNYVEPVIEVSDPLSTEAVDAQSTTWCGCCFC